MTKGPQRQKRLADVIGNALMVAKIATGEAQETFVDDGKDQNQRHLHHCLLLARILRSEALRGLSMTEKVVPYML